MSASKQKVTINLKDVECARVTTKQTGKTEPLILMENIDSEINFSVPYIITIETDNLIVRLAGRE